MGLLYGRVSPRPISIRALLDSLHDIWPMSSILPAPPVCPKASWFSIRACATIWPGSARLLSSDPTILYCNALQFPLTHRFGNCGRRLRLERAYSFFLVMREKILMLSPGLLSATG